MLVEKEIKDTTIFGVNNYVLSRLLLINTYNSLVFNYLLERLPQLTMLSLATYKKIFRISLELALSERALQNIAGSRP